MNADKYSDNLYELTRYLDLTFKTDNIQGVLGGEHGYGHEYKNDVFEMHPYYWGDCECGFDDKETEWEDTHHHAQDCYQTRLHDMCYEDYPNSFKHKEGHGRWDDRCDCVEVLCKEFGLNPNFGGYVHCTCTYNNDWEEWRSDNDHNPKCRIVLPNFRHYRTGLEIRWYKYIGRGMEANMNVPPKEWIQVMQDCISSIDRDVKND